MTAEQIKLADAAPEHDAPASAPGETPTDELHTSTEAGHDAHGAKPGLPQLDTTTFASQLFWLLISFAILYFVISRIAAPKIGGVIEGRATRIRDDVNAAGEAQRAGEEAIANYEKALSEARGRALKIGEEIRAKVQAEINAQSEAASKQLAADMQRAEARVREARANAMARVGDVAREAAADIVTKLTGEVATATEIDAAVAGAMKPV
jgi:F-type H+-transporting ATPase subunit b